MTCPLAIPSCTIGGAHRRPWLAATSLQVVTFYLSANLLHQEVLPSGSFVSWGTDWCPNPMQPVYLLSSAMSGGAVQLMSQSNRLVLSLSWIWVVYCAMVLCGLCWYSNPTSRRVVDDVVVLYIFGPGLPINWINSLLFINIHRT